MCDEPEIPSISAVSTFRQARRPPKPPVLPTLRGVHGVNVREGVGGGIPRDGRAEARRDGAEHPGNLRHFANYRLRILLENTSKSGKLPGNLRSFG